MLKLFLCDHYALTITLLPGKIVHEIFSVSKIYFILASRIICALRKSKFRYHKGKSENGELNLNILK